LQVRPAEPGGDVRGDIVNPQDVDALGYQAHRRADRREVARTLDVVGEAAHEGLARVPDEQAQAV
jgi:hypothetical protein